MAIVTIVSNSDWIVHGHTVQIPENCASDNQSTQYRNELTSEERFHNGFKWIMSKFAQPLRELYDGSSDSPLFFLRDLNF
jgi:hypothetical protein